MSVSLRELTVADVAVLRNISIATFTETFADSNSTADMALYIAQRFSENQLTQELANPESFFYTAEVQGQTVGYLKLNTGGAQTEPQQENALEIERIYVLGTPPRPRCGAGPLPARPHRREPAGGKLHLAGGVGAQPPGVTVLPEERVHRLRAAHFPSR